MYKIVFTLKNTFFLTYVQIIDNKSENLKMTDLKKLTNLYEIKAAILFT